MYKVLLLVIVLGGFLLLFFNPPKPIARHGKVEPVYACAPNGAKCNSDPNGCCNKCDPVDNTCKSLGAGLTPPSCDIGTYDSYGNIKTAFNVGDRINIKINAGDNGEVYFPVNPTVSGACSGLVGFCPINANVCTRGYCTNVCSAQNGGSSAMYTFAQSAGSCTISTSVYNGAVKSPVRCSFSVAVACPATMKLSGNFSGNPVNACVKVTDVSANKVVGTFCGKTTWVSSAVPSGHKYLMEPSAITNYSVTPLSRNSGTTCGDLGGQNFTYKSLGQHNVCSGTACTTAPGPGTDQCRQNSDCSHLGCSSGACVLLAGGGTNLCTSNADCVVATHLGCVANTCQVISGAGANECASAGSACSSPNNGFFETFGGNLTAARSLLSNQNLPSGKALSQLTLSADAGVVVGSPIDLASGVRYSDSGTGTGAHLTNYSDQSPIPSYDEFLSRTLLAGRLIKIGDILSCPAGGTDDNIHHIRFWCYSTTSVLNQEIHAALSTSFGSEIYYHVFVPDPAVGNGARTISLTDSVNKTLLIFVNADSGGLTIGSDVKVDSTVPAAALAAVVKGNLSLDPAVKQADGLFVFNGNFDDGDSSTQLVGNGSLIGSDASAFASPHGLNRKYVATSDPAEKWTFDGRYLSLYGALLARGHMTWKELTPQ